jgi:hypothetical protein
MDSTKDGFKFVFMTCKPFIIRFSKVLQRLSLFMTKLFFKTEIYRSFIIVTIIILHRTSVVNL